MIASAPTSRTAEYRRFQTDLADEISPDEALAAEEAFRRGRTALWTVAGVWAALAAAAASLPEPFWRALVSDLAGGFLTVACLALVGRYRMAFAARWLLPLSVLEAVLAPPDVAWTNLVWLLVPTFVIGGLGWVLGALLDFGASPDARRAHPWRAIASLWGFSILQGGGILLLWWKTSTGEPFPLATVAASLVCAVWPWWPGSWVARRRPSFVPDAALFLVERYMAYLMVPGLRRIEKAVEGSLEGIVGLPDTAAVRQAAARFFEEMRMAGALLYRRSAEGRMERLLGSGEAPAVVCPSERLQRYLAQGAGTALDLRNVALDWRCFFLQHELFRLERETGCRYLLPIRLGSSLRGLLLLPDGADSRRVCRDLTGAEVGKLGLVVAEAGRVGAAS